MKPDAIEFTGVKPFYEHDGYAPSLRLAMDVLDSTTMFDLGQIGRDEILHVHTSEGDISFIMQGDEWGAGIAAPVKILASSIEGLDTDETIRVDGCSIANSVTVQAGFIGQFGHLAYSKTFKEPVGSEDIAYLESLSDADRAEALRVLTFVSVQDGIYYKTLWDGLWRRTSEVLRAERELPGEQPTPIFE